MKNWNGTSWDTLYPRTDGESVYMDGYVKPGQGGAVVAADSLNAAVGKLEKGLDAKQNAIGYTPENTANKGKGERICGAGCVRGSSRRACCRSRAAADSITRERWTLPRDIRPHRKRRFLYRCGGGDDLGDEIQYGRLGGI